MSSITVINALPIRDVMSRLGINYNGKARIKCFFHNSKDTDLYINNDKNFFYCFGSKCGKAGGNFQLVQYYLNLSTFRDVYRWFESNYESVKSGFIPMELHHKIYLDQTSYKEHQDFSEIYNYLLSISPVITEKNYLVKERCLNLDDVIENNIKGVDQNQNYKSLLLKSFDIVDLIESGVFSISSKTNEPYFTFFNNPYIAPLYQDDKIVSIQSRNLPNPKYPKMPKYKFCKGRPKPQIYVPKQKKSSFYTICEGMITALSYRTTKRPAIALMSGTFNESILKELEPYKEASFMLSPDINGFQTMEDLRTLLTNNGFKVDEGTHDYIAIAKKLGKTDKELMAMDFNDYNDVLKLFKNERNRKV